MNKNWLLRISPNKHNCLRTTGTIRIWMFSRRLTQPERARPRFPPTPWWRHQTQSERKLSLMTEIRARCKKLGPVRLSKHSLITLRAISGIKCANSSERSGEFPPRQGGKWHDRQPWKTAPEQRQPADYPSRRDGLSRSNESKSNERQITTLPLSFSSSVISAQLLCLAHHNRDVSPPQKWRISILIASFAFLLFSVINALQLPTCVYRPLSATASRCYARNHRVVICSLRAATFPPAPLFSSEGNYISFCERFISRLSHYLKSICHSNEPVSPSPPPPQGV